MTSPSPDPATRAAFVPHSAPFQVASAEGAYLITPSGQRILDAAGGAIVANVGHGRREVAEAMARAAESASYVVPPFTTPERARLIDRLIDRWLPRGVTRVMFTSGGSEGVEAALRLVRQHHLAAGRTGKWKTIGLDLSYHGVTLGALAVGNHAPRRAGMEPLLVGFPHAPAPYRILGAPAAPDPADELERIILEEGPETVAAFIAEPVVGSAGGAMVPVEGYWQRARQLCDRYGMLLIADEVMTGFGRTGKTWGVDHFGVTPDVLVSGKGLAGGYAPLCGVYATEAVVAPLAEQRQDVMFHTFAGAPSACAAADVVLDILEREDLVARCERMGALLRQRLEETVGDHPNVGEIRGLGLMIGIELVKDRRTLERFPTEDRFAQRVQAQGLRRGVFYYAAGSGPVHDALLLGPPFTINGEDIDTLVNVLAESLSAAARG